MSSIKNIFCDIKKRLEKQESATFKYDIYFEGDFDFVKGGKLPGFYGGTMSCGGGANAAELGCFSSKILK